MKDIHYDANDHETNQNKVSEKYTENHSSLSEKIEFDKLIETISTSNNTQIPEMKRDYKVLSDKENRKEFIELLCKIIYAN